MSSSSQTAIGPENHPAPDGSQTFDAHCSACPRLTTFLRQSKQRLPGYHCAPVPAFGDPKARLLVVGLAPGLHGANRTGRPFTGDYAGQPLYQLLYQQGFASAAESVAADDGLHLAGARITNAVKCVPPGNKPVALEINTCNRFLAAEIEALTRLRCILALGRIAHEAVLKALGQRRAAYPFAHGAEFQMPDGRYLLDSYHCSRYNLNTRRLTLPMFAEVFARAGELAQTP